MPHMCGIGTLKAHASSRQSYRALDSGPTGCSFSALPLCFVTATAFVARGRPLRLAAAAPRGCPCCACKGAARLMAGHLNSLMPAKHSRQIVFSNSQLLLGDVMCSETIQREASSEHDCIFLMKVERVVGFTNL